VKLIASLSTPGLLPRVAAAFPSFQAGFRPQDVSDEAGTDLAVYSIQTGKPNVLFLHIWQVDAAQHKYGLGSQEARAAIETADRQIGRLLQAIKDAGIADSSVLVVASDHGFSAVTRCVNPSYLLEHAGLLRREATGKPRDWEAAALPSHGLAYIYLSRPDDVALQTKVLRVIQDAKDTGKSGIFRVLSTAEVVELGGDPSAFLALEAEPGTYFGTGHDAYETPATYRATHGYDPNRKEMRASLIMHGATVPHGRLVDARLIDIAPTLAQMLGLPLPSSAGRVLRVEGVEASPSNSNAP
jgi:predicted AlkP superfamily pyrophosphatase or phosphodiesterase